METRPKMITFYETYEQAHALRMAAAKQNQSMSAFIRDAIRHYARWLEQQEREQAAK